MHEPLADLRRLRRRFGVPATADGCRAARAVGSTAPVVLQVDISFPVAAGLSAADTRTGTRRLSRSRSVSRRFGRLRSPVSVAAYALQRENLGFQVIIYEARASVGGRVRSSTREFIPRRTIEPGAEPIGSNHHLWLDLALGVRARIDADHAHRTVRQAKALSSPRRRGQKAGGRPKPDSYIH